MSFKSVGAVNLVVPWCTMDSVHRTMHVGTLVDSFDLGRIENTLIERKKDLVQASSWVFNILLLGFVVACFGLFLYTQYHATAEEEKTVKRIPFEPIPWLSATRNVRMEEYGRQLKPREAQTGYGLPGPIGDDGFSSVYGDYTSRAARD